MKSLFKTTNSYLPTIARLTLGIVMFPHGAQKVLGWFGGYGFSGTMNFFTARCTSRRVRRPRHRGGILGSLGLITGFLWRIAAFGIAMNMIVAVIMVHAANGFFMNWYGNQKGEGFEYHILAIGLSLIVIIAGAGKLSIDRALTAEKAAA